MSRKFGAQANSYFWAKSKNSISIRMYSFPPYSNACWKLIQYVLQKTESIHTLHHSDKYPTEQIKRNNCLFGLTSSEVSARSLILCTPRHRMSCGMVIWQRMSFMKDRKWGGTGQHKSHTLSYLCSPAKLHLVQFPEPQKLCYCLEIRQSTHKPVNWISFQIITRGLFLGEFFILVWYMHTYTIANSLLLGSVGSGKKIVYSCNRQEWSSK